MSQKIMGLAGGVTGEALVSLNLRVGGWTEEPGGCGATAGVAVSGRGRVSPDSGDAVCFAAGTSGMFDVSTLKARASRNGHRLIKKRAIHKSPRAETKSAGDRHTPELSVV